MAYEIEFIGVSAEKASKDAVAICLLFTVGFSFIWTLIKKWILSRYIVIICGCLFLLLIFAKAYVKQTNYIAERIITINKLSEENKAEMAGTEKNMRSTSC